MTQAAAEKELTDLKLKVKVEEANDDTQPKGHVFDQSPEANNTVAVGDQVTIKVSQGVAVAIVPDLVNLSVDTATVQLREAGLVMGEQKAVTSDQTRNLIVKSTPKAGKQVPVGTTVDVEVASGQNKVPDVTGKSNTEAASILENAGFTPKEEPRETTDAPPGTVVDQTPAGKTNARLDSTVTIFVAQAPVSTPTPSDTVSPPPTP
jgi:serine/threonine-protein kinase